MWAIESEFFCKSEVDNEDSAALLVFSYEKVIRFYISMDESLAVNTLYPL